MYLQSASRQQYYLVIDNSNREGAVSPPWNPLAALGSANMASVACSAELGEDDDEDF